MIFCKALNKEFEDKKAMFKALKENKEILLAAKKSEKKKVFECSNFDFSGEVQKAELSNGGYIHAVMNSTNVMDSHDDVSLDGSWTKTANEQQGKVLHTSDHKIEIDKIVSFAKDVELFVLPAKFSDIGAKSDLSTELLVFRSKITPHANEKVMLAYKEGIPVQHSIRLRYFKIELALNDEESKEEKATYDKYIDRILNKEEVEKQGYFFAILEQGIVQEGSTVTSGSNSQTPLLTEQKFNELNEPSKHTRVNKKSQRTSTESLSKLILEKLKK